MQLGIVARLIDFHVWNLHFVDEVKMFVFNRTISRFFLFNKK